MSDPSVVARLLVAIQEREDVAHAAVGQALGGTWYSVIDAATGDCNVQSRNALLVPHGLFEVGPHIALNDPSSVLRLCQSHRDIVDDYQHAREVGDRLIERDCEVGTRVVQQRAVNALERAIRALARGYGIEDGETK